MKEYERAIAIGQRLIDGYPEADPVIRRAAWASIAHSFFDTEDFVQAEHAYGSVLEMLEPDDDSHQAVVDSLAAAIYKQGELANVVADYRAAADHFLRIPQLAPSSAIRPAAEYDAGAALIRLEDWAGAATVLEAFRENHPKHELQREATKQIALVYRSKGNLSRAAEEYERVAAEAEESDLRREALLIAGELYEESKVIDRALVVYLGFVKQFPQPLEVAVETRFKIAELYKATNDTKRHEEQLRKIVAIDKSAGEAGNDRIRFFAAKSALALTVDLYHRFGEVKLVQPFDKNLKKKKKRMDEALAGFEALVDYEVGEATAGATYYIAEIYFDFSQSLLESERPDDLSGADLMDYEMVLEEEAFPFEEQAIEVHEKNLELMTVGVYNRWIEKSLGKLAALMPGRYAKFEESSGLITSIDRYAYQVPEVTAELEAEPAAGGATDSEEPDLPANPAIEVESAQQSPPSAFMAAG
jgi:tetratricopeptide (TPR) repeat protein